jgi:hypothetical protein
MYAVVRQYRGANELFEALARRRADVEQLLRGVPGFVAYTLVRATSGGISVTICEDRAGTEASTERVAAWVRQEVPGASWRPPEVTAGEVLYQFDRAVPLSDLMPGVQDAGVGPTATVTRHR